MERYVQMMQDIEHVIDSLEVQRRGMTVWSTGENRVHNGSI